jgi:asparagine synthase (glutamine-hydrolysing)
MCGFAGLVMFSERRELGATARRMAEQIAHRGPDDTGEWVDPLGKYAVGFRRLAILDLSQAGHQPMHSRSGRYVLVFNGEVFNHQDIRDELGHDGASYRGTSDTETLLAAFEAWGVVRTLQRTVGMFAIAVWDTEARTVSIARDRLGKKPMFVARYAGRVAFGSELKAIVCDPEFPRELDYGGIASYLRHLYVPAPLTIYRAAEKLVPGIVLTVNADTGAETREEYWSLTAAARRGTSSLLPNDPAVVLDELDRVLGESVRMRLLSDVPLGTLLSGGIDSSIVTAMAAQASGSAKLRTFSVSFPDAPEHDEGAFARAVAAHCGTDHTELQVRGADMLNVVPSLPQMFDEPMADHSLLPAHVICREARKHVTVVLTGDGGDEIFAGYHRYFDGAKLISRVSGLSRGVRSVGGAALQLLGDGALRAIADGARAVGVKSAAMRLPASRLRKLSLLLKERTPEGMYRSLVSSWTDPSALVPRGTEPRVRFDDLLEGSEPEALVDRMMLADQASYMVDDQLAKVDRVSMAVSLEARVPMLDHRVVELGWRIPYALKARDGQGKWILRQLLYQRYVPQALVDRPKVGFTVPMGAWLRGALRPWGEELINSRRLGAGELLAPGPVRAEWRRIQAGDDSRGLRMWSVLMLLQWADAWRPSET